MTDIKQYIAEQAANIVNGARRGAYGKPEHNFARIAMLWQAWFYARGLMLVERGQCEADHHTAGGACANDPQIPVDYEYHLQASDISPMMRLMKEARLCETPDHLDSHMDIVGYALTGAEVAGVQMPKELDNLTQAEVIKRFQAYERTITELQNALADRGVASSQAAEKAQVAAERTSP